MQTYGFNPVNAGIFESKDTGLTWTYKGISGYTVNDLVSYNDTTYAATNDGVFMFTSAGLVAGIENIEKASNNIAVNLFPDPAKTNVNIDVSLPKTAFTTLKIYDLTGKEMNTLCTQYLPAGSHTFQWNTNGAYNGVYIYRLQSGNDVRTGKFIIEK